MLQLIDVRKSYTTGDFIQTALDGINLNFRDNEFVAILGPSGSGKTTTLNIIGGLDHYDTGDLIIDNVSTKEYKDRDWDTYRNNRIGFVFQSYNLIPHQTVLSNVELALTLSGVSKAERRKRAVEALGQVGLGDHINKRPSQLSGGQMQRVAIARALINNPEILLADEPTGALDSKTSVQIMDLLTEIAKDRLVIMVTHNPELAEQYANRIVTLADGRITSDTNPFVPTENDFHQSTKQIRKSSMSFLTALALSFNNLMTKKGRTIMTAFAGSIGIIGIAAILSLSTGVNAYIDSIEENTLSEYPLQITSTGFDMTSMLVGASVDSDSGTGSGGSDSVPVAKMVENMVSSMGNNDLASLREYLESDECDIYDYAKAIQYDYGVTPLIYNSDTSGKLHQANPNTTITQLYGSSASSFMSSSSVMSSDMFQQLPSQESLYKDQYDVKAGHWPENYDEVVLVLSSTGRITDYLAYVMDLRDPDELSSAIRTFMSGDSELEITEGANSYTYDELMGVTFKLVNEADCYQKDSEYNTWLDKTDDTDYMRDLVDNGTTLRIVGIVQAKEDASVTMLDSGLYYTEDLTNHIVDYAANSDIVKQQLADKDVDVFSGKTFAEEEEESGSSFDLGSLFTIDSNAMSNAFSMDTSALSSLGNMSGISSSVPDLGSVAENAIKDAITEAVNSLATSFVASLYDGTPQPDMSSLSPADQYAVGTKLMNYLQNDFATQATTVFATEAAGYISQYVSASMSGADLPSVEDYLSSSAAQSVVDAALSGAIDCTDLSDDATAFVQSYLTDQLKPFLMAKLQSSLDSSVMKDILLDTTGEIGAAMLETVSALSSAMQTMSQAMSTLGSALSGSMSIDTSAFANAFQFNMDETQLTELMMSLMSSDTASADSNLRELGYADYAKPSGIDIYPWDFESKEKIIDILDGYNERMEQIDESKVISYTDIVGVLMSSVTTIINAITTMLIAFVAISLVVSSIMIGIITYISVLERRKEIGILRAMGASKGNVSQVFNAETIIVGLFAGLIGVGLTALACPPVSAIAEAMTDVPNVMQLPIAAAVILVCISVLLTFIGGLIPAKSASRKDPVEALRSE